jgi:ferredoxin
MTAGTSVTWLVGYDDNSAEETTVPLRIELNPAVCTGHGRCYDLAPELFAPDDAGNGTVIKGIAESADDRKAAALGQQSCPEGAITVAEQD